VKYSFFFAALLFVLILSGNYVYASQSMTLQDCLAAAMQHNPSLKASRFNVDASAYDINMSRADFLPSVSSNYSVKQLNSISSQGPTETDYLDQDINTLNFTLSQILYAGSRIVNAYEKSKINEQLAVAEMELNKLELAYQVETTFYRLKKAGQDVIMVSESVNRLTESIKAADAFFQQELVPYVDVLQARVDLADAKEQLGIARNDVNRERAALFSLMGLPLDTDILFAAGGYDSLISSPSFDVSMEQALKNRPDIKALEFQREIARKQAEIAIGKYLPMVKFDIGYHDQDRDYDALGVTNSGAFDRDQRNRYWTAGVNVSWELFDGGRAWYEKQKYETEEKKIAALMEDAKTTIATGIRKALYSLSEAEQRLSSAQQTLSAANEYYDAEENRLNAGLATIPSLLDAQERLVRAEASQTRAILDYQVAISELKMMTGGKLPIR
jgi:outer membrane protein TolC